jgi:hypothetical protein
VRLLGSVGFPRTGGGGPFVGVGSVVIEIRLSAAQPDPAAAAGEEAGAIGFDRPDESGGPEAAIRM